MAFKRNGYLENLWICWKQELSHGWRESKNYVLSMIAKTFKTWMRANKYIENMCFKMKYRKELMYYVLARIADDRSAYEIANEIDVILAIEWIPSAQISKDTIENCFAKCGVVDHPASIDDDEDGDEEFKNLFEELSEE